MGSPRGLASEIDSPTTQADPLEPHVYTVATRAMQYLVDPTDQFGRACPTNQSIIISGESG